MQLKWRGGRIFWIRLHRQTISLQTQKNICRMFEKRKEMLTKKEKEEHCSGDFI